jgi:Tfp pilus assembly protein PilX
MINMNQQRGVALITALVFMVTITLLGVISMRSSILELRLSGNEQARLEAYEIAQSAADQIVNNAENDDGYLELKEKDYNVCTANLGDGATTLPVADDSSCDQTDLVFDKSAAPFNTGVLWIKVTQLTEFSPTSANKLPRGLSGTSQLVFTSVQYQITANYDDTANGNGSAQVTQGFLKLIPTSGT